MPSRTASGSIGCRTPNTTPSSASTTPTARNSAFPTSSASAATPGIPSCAISSAACRTTPQAETQTSIEEICRIAALRLDQQVASDDRLAVHGRLSTHVLDTHTGRPAAGIAVELVELSELGQSRVVTRAITNADGRTDQPLIGGRPVPIGRYELHFQRRTIFCRTQGAAVGPAVPRPDPPALFGQRARRPSARAAAGDALELRDLSGELRASLLVASRTVGWAKRPVHRSSTSKGRSVPTIQDGFCR